jgi:hypothetical protein
MNDMVFLACYCERLGLEIGSNDARSADDSSPQQNFLGWMRTRVQRVASLVPVERESGR